MLNIKGIISNIIQEIASNSSIPRTIDISEDRIVDKLLAEKNSNTFLWHRLGQIIILSIVALSFLYILASMILFFLFDVILFEPRVYTTINGATVITQPCGIEQAFFIHNSANHWTNSGIDIVEGDRITVSYSGSFYSTLRDLADASKYPEVAKYEWSSVYRTENTPRSVVNYCSFNGEKGYFGSLLYQIGDNKEMLPKICQMDFSNGKYSFCAPSSGPLQISVNDIYISDTCMVKKMLKDEHFVFSKGQKKEIIKRLDLQEKTNTIVLMALVDSLDSISRSKIYILDSIDDHITRIVKQAEWYTHQVWNNDSIGNLLLTPQINPPDPILISLLRYKKQINDIETPKKIDSIYSKIDSLVSQAQWDAQEIWYNDNIGELFVTVQIIRNNLNYANPINKQFAKLYRYFDEIWERRPLIFIAILLLCVLAYIQFLIFYSFWVSLFSKRKQTKIIPNYGRRNRTKKVSKNKMK